MAITVFNSVDPKQMSNFHFDLPSPLKLSQGEVHHVSGEVYHVSGEVHHVSGHKNYCTCKGIVVKIHNQ